MTDISMTVGVPVVAPVDPPPSGETWTAPATSPLPGVSWKPSRTDANRLEGTPTTEGVTVIELEGDDGYGMGVGRQTVTVTVRGPVVVIPAPAAESTEDGYMLPEVEGVRWLVDGTETAPGTYSVQPVTETTTVTIIPEALDGWELDPAAVPLVLTFDPAPAPDPDPDPEPWEPPVRPPGDYPGPWPSPAPPAPSPEDEAVWMSLMDDDPQAMFVATKLAERIIRHVGRDVADMDPAEVLTARDHAMVVLEYVKGYTRDRGFVGYAPHRSIQAVIVSAAARLFTNPEQLTYYSTGDYSERPATMTGWTHAELGVLRRFRKVYA